MRFVRELGVLVTLLTLAACVSTYAPPGVPRGISFNVAPVFPHRYDIVAFGSRTFDEDELRDAWNKKAAQVAAGRRFTASTLVFRKTEAPGGGIPVFGRSVSGTITISD